ncbi:hypothetical protein ACHWQZ_G016619 [Mnemiopsis leidyi]
MDPETSEGEDQEVTSEILNETEEYSDDNHEQEESTVPVEITKQASDQSEQIDKNPTSPITRSVTILPPISSTVGMEKEVQTEITLLSGSNISTFRPSHLVEEISPYPPLPVIETTSAPALLKSGEKLNDSESKTNVSESKLQAASQESVVSVVNEESRSDFNPTDEESVSTYSVISELEGVGPPTILQYVKESTRVKRTVPAPKPLSERFPTVDPSVERSNMCPFCHTELLPVPPLSDGSDDEGETSPPRTAESPPYHIKDTEKGEAGPIKGAGAMSVFSVESPPPILGLGEDNEEDKLPNDGYLYCCEDYYWHLVNKNRMERRDSFYQEGEAMEVKKIDVSPHAPFGSKAARKLAKDRANERVRERELEKVRPIGGPPRAGGGATTLFSYARQMKTINFALSSRKCMEDGWTVTNYQPPPESPPPVLYDTVDETQSHPLPGLNVPWQQNCTEFHRYYRNGTIFLTLLPDGTGTCYYPSGAPAIVISLEQPGIYCYYVLSDSDTNAQLLAVCSQLGRIAVFYPNGLIHYQCSPIEGNLFNKEEVRTKHWEWDAFSPHVHAPPFQPVYFQISPFFSLRCVSLEQQTLVFNYKRYTFKCSVGSRTRKLRAKPLEQQQLLQYNKDLIETRNQINDNLRVLNNCINSAHHLTQREVHLKSLDPEIRSRTSPRKSADSTRVTLAV